jgi:hypothetical protein
VTCVTVPDQAYGYPVKQGKKRVEFEMDIESFSGAATVAATCTIVFVLVAKSWQLIARRMSPNPPFSDTIAREAAQRFRDEFERLGNKQSVYLGACLVFVLLFVAAHELQAERLYARFPAWQLNILTAALVAGAVLAVVKIGLTIASLHHVKLLRDANLAIGHQLQRTSSEFGRVYHDVETNAGMVDHVIVGKTGVYAISVAARRPVRDGQVTLDKNELCFDPPGHSESIVAIGKGVAALEREFRRLLDHRVRVRSVIAVPGWEVAEQSCGEHLLVNERNLQMLQGWKDQSDYLINEDVEALQALLAQLTGA